MDRENCGWKGSGQAREKEKKTDRQATDAGMQNDWLLE